jgi:hypothetical protein
LVHNLPVLLDISKLEFRNIYWKSFLKAIYQQLAKKHRPEPKFCAQKSQTAPGSFFAGKISGNRRFADPPTQFGKGSFSERSKHRLFI